LPSHQFGVLLDTVRINCVAGVNQSEQDVVEESLKSWNRRSGITELLRTRISAGDAQGEHLSHDKHNVELAGAEV
jgi:hypothetical protein